MGESRVGGLHIDLSLCLLFCSDLLVSLGWTNHEDVIECNSDYSLNSLNNLFSVIVFLTFQYAYRRILSVTTYQETMLLHPLQDTLLHQRYFISPLSLEKPPNDNHQTSDTESCAFYSYYFRLLKQSIIPLSN